MKYLKLINHKRRVKVDDELYPFLVKMPWRLHNRRPHGINEVGCVLPRKVVGTRRNRMLKHVVLGLTNPKGAGFVCIGYANDNVFDCQRANLLVKTKSEAGARRKKHRKASSQYKGVSWNTERSLWVSKIMVHGKHITVGSFHDEVKAAQAYDRAAVEHQGENARTNFQ